MHLVLHAQQFLQQSLVVIVVHEMLDVLIFLPHAPLRVDDHYALRDDFHDAFEEHLLLDVLLELAVDLAIVHHCPVRNINSTHVKEQLVRQQEVVVHVGALVHVKEHNS